MKRKPESAAYASSAKAPRFASSTVVIGAQDDKLFKSAVEARVQWLLLANPEPLGDAYSPVDVAAMVLVRHRAIRTLLALTDVCSTEFSELHHRLPSVLLDLIAAYSKACNVSVPLISGNPTLVNVLRTASPAAATSVVLLASASASASASALATAGASATSSASAAASATSASATSASATSASATSASATSASPTSSAPTSSAPTSGGPTELKVSNWPEFFAAAMAPNPTDVYILRLQALANAIHMECDFARLELRVGAFMRHISDMPCENLRPVMHHSHRIDRNFGQSLTAAVEHATQLAASPREIAMEWCTMEHFISKSFILNVCKRLQAKLWNTNGDFLKYYGADVRVGHPLSFMAFVLTQCDNIRPDVSFIHELGIAFASTSKIASIPVTIALGLLTWANRVFSMNCLGRLADHVLEDFLFARSNVPFATRDPCFHLIDDAVGPRLRPRVYIPRGPSLISYSIY